MPNLFSYSDYRQYLREYYETHKLLNRNFSFRYFAQRAGINSSAFYKNIIDGTRNLTKTTLLQTCIALKLKDREAEYFENLVFFNQAKTIKQKNFYFENLTKIRGLYDQKKIQEDQFAFYNEWYHSAIRELLECLSFKGDFKTLADSLTPVITEKQATASLELLVRMGLVKKNAQGKWQATDPVITTGGQVDSSLIVEFQKSMIQLAQEAFSTTRAPERLISATTFGISEPNFELFKKKIRALKAELLELAKLDDSPNRVYQLNLQFFPLSKKIQRRLNNISRLSSVSSGTNGSKGEK